MLDADGTPQKRSAFSLEFLELWKERTYDKKKAESLQRFIGQILQIQNNDIDIDVKKEWDMQSIPLDEAVKKIHIRVATEQGMERGMKKGREEGMEIGMREIALQVARSMLVDGFSPELIQKYTGLDKKIILALR